MEDKYLNKYRTTPARLIGWDYGAHGLYFVTICTKDRLHYFGEIVASEGPNSVSFKPTEMGSVAYDNWLKVPEHFPFVELDEFVVMPDHIHGILFINKPDKTDWDLNKFGAQSRNLASIIRGYKASVKKHATINEINFAWQPKYHDRIIRNENEYQNIKQYIFDNPEKWLLNGCIDDEIYISK